MISPAGTMLFRARDLTSEYTIPDSSYWSYQALIGRLTEISGSGASAATTFAALTVKEAQQMCEPVVWIACGESIFFPPDMAACGVTLELLPVIRVTETATAARVADTLLRSGAFGLIVLDLGRSVILEQSAQGRLLRLAQRFDSGVLCITRKSAGDASVGGMISLRGHAVRHLHSAGHYRCELQIIKDKKMGPGRQYAEVCHAPAGMR